MNVLKSSEIIPQNGIHISVQNATHNNTVYPHAHEFFEFVYVVEGFTIHYFNQETTFLTEGDIFYIPKGVSHGYAGVHYTKVYNCLFTEDALKDGFEELLGMPGLGSMREYEAAVWNHIRLTPAERLRTAGLLQKMYEEQQARESGWQIMMHSLLMQFILSFSRYYEKRYKPAQTDKTYFSYIIKALKYIEECYGQDINLQSMAAFAGVSGDYLSRHFKSVMGLSPVVFLRNYRFARAVDLIRADSQLPIKHVAEAVGYKYFSHFSREFKAFTGMSPNDFKHSFIEVS